MRTAAFRKILKFHLELEYTDPARILARFSLHPTPRDAAVNRFHSARLAEQLLEIGDRFFQSVFQRRLRFPTEQLLRLRNVGLTLPRVVLRQWPARDFRLRARQIEHLLCKLNH